MEDAIKYHTIHINHEKYEIQVRRYSVGGGLHISLFSFLDGPYGTLSINLFGHQNTNLISKIGGLAEGEFVVNHDWFEVPSLREMLENILQLDLFEDTEKRVSYGFCKDIPIWKYLG